MKDQIETVARPKLIDELALAIDQFLSHQIERDTLACDLTQDELTELATGLAAIAAMPVQAEPQWQGIESAPRDGTSVLLLIDGLAIEGAYDDKTMPNGYKYGEGEWDLVRLPSHGCGCCSFDNPEPTHWMPLPTPPAGGSDAE